MTLQKTAVIGAGVMGAAIAAHLANAGCEVLLLDIVPEGASDRSIIAKDAVAKMVKTKPAPFMHKRNAKRIIPANIEDDLEALKDADWIIEAVIERVDIKQDLYKKLAAVKKPDAIISSNTSTIPLAHLVKDMPEAFVESFMITHFFNPPRYMRLLELVTGEKTRADLADKVAKFADVHLGKGVVSCNDTPGFIANRIGTFWIQSAVNNALKYGVTVEEADAVLSKPIGVPKTGVFGLMDLVGLDLMPHIAASLLATLPEKDAYRDLYKSHDVIEKMIADGYIGRKGKGGFYRLNKDGGKKVKEAIDLKTGVYAPAQRPKVEAVALARKGGLKALLEHKSPAGQYAWSVLADTFSYAASLVPEICDHISDLDEAMRLGYNFKFGPFELMDQVGIDYILDRFASEGRSIPDLLAKAKGQSFYKIEDGNRFFLTSSGTYQKLDRAEGVLLLEDVKRASQPVAKNGSASVWDIGDGVLCLEFTSKMNSIDDQIMRMYQKVLGLIGDGTGTYKALVIYNEGSNFSVGANLGLALFAINIALYPQVEALIAEGQQTYKKLKYAPFPVVSAPAGMALGGGCEILLHSDHIQAHAESYMGLVEVGVGVVPGWGGCKEMILRHQANEKAPNGYMPAVGAAFETISTAKVSTSAEEAKSLLYMRPQDGVTMNRDRLLYDAKQKALELSKEYQPPKPVEEIYLPGPSGKTALNMAVAGFADRGLATPHDVTVSDALAEVLSGGKKDLTEPRSEDDLLELEREQFMRLVHDSKTLDRIEHMLTTGKPLRN